MKTCLITGSAGMLGSAFLKSSAFKLIAIDRSALNENVSLNLQRLMSECRPDFFINCAANVDAEAAEDNADAAFYTNALLPGLIAAACRRANVSLLHFSSTGCYGDWKATPYCDFDALRPTTAHHRSKKEGEKLIRASGCEHLILRTGWLFGGEPQHKKNFVWRRILEASAESEMFSDASQYGNPTYTDDVVRQSEHLIREKLTGTFNCVGEGAASRFEYVSKIVEAAGLQCRVLARGAFDRKASVSPNETATNYYLAALGLNLMQPWRESMTAYIRVIRNWPEWQALQSKSANAGR